MRWSAFWRAGLGPCPPPVVAAYPPRKALLKRLILPATSARDIQNMAALQACRQIPLPADKTVVRSCRLGGAPGGASDALMIVARKSDIESHVQALQASGVWPDRLVLDGVPES